MSNVKRILILCYDFYPYNSISAQRPYSWYKYFKQFGLYPIVITRHWDHGIKSHTDYIRPSTVNRVEKEESSYGTIIRVPQKANLRDKMLLKFGINRFSLIRKLLSLTLSFAKFLSLNFDNTSNIYRESEKYLKANKCTVIIATGEPFILCKYASQVSDKYNIPWVADFRDDWSTNYRNPDQSTVSELIMKHFFQPFERYWEKYYLKNVTLITTVSHACKNTLSQLHSDKPIEVIYNGYDLSHPNVQLDGKQNHKVFEIAYVGTLYPHQQLELFLEGYKNFILEAKCNNTKAIFYGLGFFPKQEKRLFAYNNDLNKVLETTDRIAHHEVINKLQNSSVLLLLADEGIDGSCAKIFEYLALSRKILLVKDDKGSLSKIMDECNGGIKCSTAREVTESLKLLYQEHSKDGSVQHQSGNYEAYSRENQCSVLTETINKFI